MEGIVFINEAVTFAINKYLDSKEDPDSEEFNLFLVVVIRALVLIYGELDIMNPFRSNNEIGFDTNLKKFGLTETSLKEFKNQLLLFYHNQENLEISKDTFLEIQKKLIDMFTLRQKNVNASAEWINQFKSFLYLREDTNPFKFLLYTKYSPDSDEILYYFNSKVFEIQHQFHFTEYKEVALSAEAYQLAGYNAVSVMNMKEEEIENINNKVYHFFRIKDTDLNKRKRLESAIKYYKKYGNTITSGNGYVDLLLILSVVATGLMLVFLLGIKFAE